MLLPPKVCSDPAAIIAAFAIASALTLSAGCGSEDGPERDPTLLPDTAAEGVAAECGSVRMTQYGASDRRWCGFDRTHAVLPSFVREGMTIAIAEPYNGSSYSGEPGEACGECWEVSTTFATEIVMVHDLCPIEGNPICAGSHFHFDVANEVAASIDGGAWLGEAAVRRVPCPVSGDIHVYITARNRYGYLQLAFFNHRFPIRQVEYRAADSEQWFPLERCLARWCLEGDTHTFSDDGPGGLFRFTSAAGEVVEGTRVLGYDTPEKADFDTGAQFAEAASPAGVCTFTPPGDVYDEAWGGIEGVRWTPNTWGDATLSEVDQGCAEGSTSCLRLGGFEGSGLHITYRHVFPVETFASLSLQLRAPGATGTVEVAPRTADARCSVPTIVDVGESWTTATLELATACPEATEVHGLTISRSHGLTELMVDEIRLLDP